MAEASNRGLRGASLVPNIHLLVALGDAGPAPVHGCCDLVETRYSWRSIASQHAAFLSETACAR